MNRTRRPERVVVEFGGEAVTAGEWDGSVGVAGVVTGTGALLDGEGSSDTPKAGLRRSMLTALCLPFIRRVKCFGVRAMILNGPS